MRQTLQRLGLKPTGGNYKSIYRKIDTLKLDTSHWLGQGYRRGQTGWVCKIPLEDILVKGSTYTSSFHLRHRLVDEGVLEDRCYACGITEWQGKPLSLHLEHVNGDNSDHRLENLTLLCPNCHSQTPTYCGRNIGRNGGIGRHAALKMQYPTGCEGSSPSSGTKKRGGKKKNPPDCVVCHKKVRRPGRKYCSNACRALEQRRAEWPSKEQLAKLLSEESVLAIGRRFGVSDNAVRKWAKMYGLVE
jgi:hypothetical protein